MHKPLMESDMVNYLKRYHDLMVKSIGVFYVFSYDNLVCIVLSYSLDVNPGAPKKT